MSTPDDVLGWIRPAIEEMTRDYSADPGKPWEERREFLLSRLGLHDASQDPVVQELLERLDETPEDERNRIVGSDHELDSLADEIVRRHYDGRADGGAGTADRGTAETGYDEQAWQAFFAQNGPQWDGTDASWDQFRQWFEYHADQQGLAAPATALLQYLAPMSAAERITALAQYGVTIQTGHEAAGGDGAAYDEQAWQAYLAQNGPQWDGTDASWDQFRQWFEYHADQQGLAAPATALLDYLAPQPAAERITALARYGVTITPPVAAAAQEHAATDQGQEEPAQPDDAEASAEEIESIVGDALKTHPEINDMSEDERMKAMSEVLDRLGAG